jgi:hypothetical protein
MKTTISKILSTLMLTATFSTSSLVLTSCKEENVQVKTDASDASNSTGNIGKKVVLAFPTCAPIPDILKVEEGNCLVLQTFARGFQIYQVKRSATDPTVFSWVNIAPLADLYTRPDFHNEVIHHFAGPTWEFIKGPEKGEKIVAKKVQGITKDVSAIQWLLLKAVDSLSTPNNKITFVQRICTVGGLAPTTVADEAHLGQLDSIPYTASYLFYAKSNLLSKE